MGLIHSPLPAVLEDFEVLLAFMKEHCGSEKRFNLAVVE